PDAAGARARRTGNDSAEPPRLFVCGYLPGLRAEARMPELCHRAHPSQALGREWARTRRTAPRVSLLRIQTDGAIQVFELRERASLLPRRGFGTGRGAPYGDLSRGTYRPDGSRHRARAA